MSQVREFSLRKRRVLLGVGIAEACFFGLATAFARFLILYYADEHQDPEHDYYLARIVSTVGIGVVAVVALLTWRMWRGSWMAAAALAASFVLLCGGVGAIYVASESPLQFPGARFWLIVALITVLVAVIRAMVAIERSSHEKKP